MSQTAGLKIQKLLLGRFVLRETGSLPSIHIQFDLFLKHKANVDENKVVRVSVTRRLSEFHTVRSVDDTLY